MLSLRIQELFFILQPEFPEYPNNGLRLECFLLFHNLKGRSSRFLAYIPIVSGYGKERALKHQRGSQEWTSHALWVMPLKMPRAHKGVRGDPYNKGFSQWQVNLCLYSFLIGYYFEIFIRKMQNVWTWDLRSGNYSMKMRTKKVELHLNDVQGFREWPGADSHLEAVIHMSTVYSPLWT